MVDSGDLRYCAKVDFDTKDHQYRLVDLPHLHHLELRNLTEHCLESIISFS